LGQKGILELFCTGIHVTVVMLMAWNHAKGSQRPASTQVVAFLSVLSSTFSMDEKTSNSPCLVVQFMMHVHVEIMKLVTFMPLA